MQVILGLQSNALKFTTEGQVQITVEITKKLETNAINSYLEISVVDTGIGIAIEDQDKLFKLFGFV
jgi:two-component system, sensor histidine kinase